MKCPVVVQTGICGRIATRFYGVDYWFIPYPAFCDEHFKEAKKFCNYYSYTPLKDHKTSLGVKIE